MEIQIIDNSGAIVASYPGARIISFDGGVSYFCTGYGNPKTLGITFPGGASGSFISGGKTGTGILYTTQNGGATWEKVI